MSENTTDKRPRFEPLTAIGVFLIVFGLAVCGAVFLSMPAADKIINLGCGLLIVGIGVVCYYISYKERGQDTGDHDPESEE